MTPRGFPSWEDLYKAQSVTTMPWYFAALDPDLLQALRAHGVAKGRVLDVGTGPGTQAMALAELGFDVVGTDISPTAVNQAAQLAKDRGLTVSFVQDDVLDSKVQGPFDIVVDRGCFHVLEPGLRPHYVKAIASLLGPAGLLVLKCFSDEQPGNQGPYRFRPEDIRQTFGTGLDVLSIDRTEYQGTLTPQPKALCCVMRKK